MTSGSSFTCYKLAFPILTSAYPDIHSITLCCGAGAEIATDQPP